MALGLADTLLATALFLGMFLMLAKQAAAYRRERALNNALRRRVERQEKVIKLIGCRIEEANRKVNYAKHLNLIAQEALAALRETGRFVFYSKNSSNRSRNNNKTDLFEHFENN